MMQDHFETPDGETLSASQLETFELCQRKWAWRKIDGIKSDPHPSAELGTKIHEMLEQWMRHGVAPDLDLEVEIGGKTVKPGPMAAVLLKHIPAPGTPGVVIEAEVFVRTAVTRLMGYKDLGYIDAATGLHVVNDYKSTSNFKWAKTPEDLKTDIQANIYAAAEMAEHGVDEVLLRWAYTRTRGKAASKLVELRITRAEVEKNFDRIDETAAQVLAAYKSGKTAIEFEASPAACDAFGGCFYVEHCNLTPIQRLKAKMAKQGLAAKMAERKAKLEAEAKAGGTTEATEAPTGTGSINPEGEAPAALKEKKTEAPAGTDAKAEKAAAAAERKAKREAAKASKAAEATASTPEPTTAPATAPARAAAPVIPPGSAIAGAATGGASVVPFGPGFTLFVDCVPSNGIVLSASHLSGPAQGVVCKEFGVPHYRLAEFAKGPAALETAVRSHFKSNPLSGVGVTLDTRTELGRDLLTVLTDLASTVVRAF